MRWLIINADDFGLCEASNIAVEDLFNVGAITTATLMVPAPYAEDGIRRALNNPRMKIGLHLTTTAEYDTYRWGPICKEAVSLVDSEGYFYRTAKENLARATYDDMVSEIHAQYDWMEMRGLHPDHIDSHMATVYGLVGMSCMDAALELCYQHELNFRFPHLTTIDGNTPEPIKERVLRDIAWADEHRVGLPVALYTYDYDLMPEDTYEFFREQYMNMIRSCPDGVSELFMHPCIETEQIKEINEQWKKRVWEYRILKDPVFHACLKAEHIRLTSYSDAPFFPRT